MAERVSPLELGVSWEPNVPAAVLISNDLGSSTLAMRAHPDDEDQRCVVLVWTGSMSASMAGPNDEAISGHRLYEMGLSELSWAGVVQQSELVQALERQDRAHPAHDRSRYSQLAHHVLLLKEGVVEVAARALTIERRAGSTLAAAVAVITR